VSARLPHHIAPLRPNALSRRGILRSCKFLFQIVSELQICFAHTLRSLPFVCPQSPQWALRHCDGVVQGVQQARRLSSTRRFGISPVA